MSPSRNGGPPSPLSRSSVVMLELHELEEKYVIPEEMVDALMVLGPHFDELDDDELRAAWVVVLREALKA